MKYQIIIPARANSKRLPGKNMKLLSGKPLIQYSIESALEILEAINIWVNSDDLSVIKFAKSFGIQTLIRPDKLSSDFTTTAEVLEHHASHLIKKVNCDAIILLQPTNPFRSINFVKEAIRIFQDSGRESLATFSSSNRKLGNIVNNVFEPINYSFGQRSQDLDSSYYENGLLYIAKTKAILRGEILTEDVYPLICDDLESSVDIDTIEDFLYAEAILNVKNNL